MESVRMAVVCTGRAWARFVIATEPRGFQPSQLYWSGTNWVPERRKALLYADPGLAQRDMARLRAKR
jgi:hypothetical protein